MDGWMEKKSDMTQKTKTFRRSLKDEIVSCSQDCCDLFCDFINLIWKNSILGNVTRRLMCLWYSDFLYEISARRQLTNLLCAGLFLGQVQSSFFYKDITTWAQEAHIKPQCICKSVICHLNSVPTFWESGLHDGLINKLVTRFLYILTELG